MAWLLIAVSHVVKHWRAYVLLAFACAVAAALLYARHRWIAQGEANKQRQWDESVARGREEIAWLDRENAAAEAKARAEAIAIGESRNRDLQDALARKDRDIAGLQRGTVRLRRELQDALSQAAAGQSTADPFQPDGAEGLRGGLAPDLAGAFGQTFYVGDAATADVKALQEFVQVQQEFMRSVCPVQ